MTTAGLRIRRGEYKAGCAAQGKRIATTGVGTGLAMTELRSSCRQSVDSLRRKNGNFRKSSHFCKIEREEGITVPSSQSPHASRTFAAQVCLQSELRAGGRPVAVPTAGTASDDILLPGRRIPSCAKQTSSPSFSTLSDALDFCQVCRQFFLERYAVMRYYKSRRIVCGPFRNGAAGLLSRVGAG